MEIWKDIPNYRGYQVSNKGRIRSYEKTTFNRYHGTRHWVNKILKPKKSTDKYGRHNYRVDLWNENGCKTLLISRLVAFTFFDKNINDKELTVNHINKNSLDNRLENLEIISLKENIQHAFRTGVSSQKKVKIINKITGTIILPSSLNEGSKIIGKNHGYLSSKIKKNIFEDNEYSWEIIS